MIIKPMCSVYNRVVINGFLPCIDVIYRVTILDSENRWLSSGSFGSFWALIVAIKSAGRMTERRLLLNRKCHPVATAPSGVG